MKSGVLRFAEFFETKHILWPLDQNQSLDPSEQFKKNTR